MNRHIAMFLFSAWTTTAFAIPPPPDNIHRSARATREATSPLSATQKDADVNIGPAGAMLERDYFQAPSAFNSGAFPCRFGPSMFEKAPLTQSCR